MSEPKSKLDQSGDFLAVGRFRRAHGVRGDLLFTIITDFPERLKPGTVIYVGDEKQEFKISRTKPHNDGIIFGFRNIKTPEEAKTFVGQYVFVSSADRPQLPEGEYYHHQIIGLTVIDEKHGELGKVSDILETGANDVYVIKTPENKEILFPALNSVILNIDLASGSIQVRLPEGLV